MLHRLPLHHTDIGRAFDFCTPSHRKTGLVTLRYKSLAPRAYRQPWQRDCALWGLFAVVVQFPLFYMPHRNGEIGNLATFFLRLARGLAFRRRQS